MSDGRLLSQLVALVPGSEIVGGDTTVFDVTHDSRSAAEGTLFVAVVGMTSDGHDFVDDAISAGAPALVVEVAQSVDVPQLIVPSSRSALPVLAAAVHQHPSRRMDVVGVTGTNGKTTVTHLVEAIGRVAGKTTGVVGTVGARIAGAVVPVPRTTPEASDLQRLLADMAEAGVDLVAIEVSSHALALGRVEEVQFRVAAFTNLSQDHLDFHGDMDAYFAAKRSLFSRSRIERAVVCIDDAAGRWIASSSEVPTRTVAVDGPADVTAVDVRASLQSTSFTLEAAEGSIPVDLPLPGRFNLANALLAAGICLELGVTPAATSAGLGAVAPIPGRFERVEAGQVFSVFVDYAHTPAAVATIVDEVRTLAAGKVIAVVGAGGDRDREKRPLMGEAAARADVAIITSDNPRTEDPGAIAGSVAAGAEPSGTEVILELDRRRAIRRALGSAEGDDVVLILGKGHEQGQEIDGEVSPFDDRTVAVEELAALAPSNGGGR